MFHPIRFIFSRITPKTLERIARPFDRLGLYLGWNGISYSSSARRGYIALTWHEDMTPWSYSYEVASGSPLWSLSIHIPGLQFQVIGPFDRY